MNGNGHGLPDQLLARLFAHAAPEDLVGYEPSELAALAESAFAFLGVRKPGAPKIRFVSPDPVPARGNG